MIRLLLVFAVACRPRGDLFSSDSGTERDDSDNLLKRTIHGHACVEQNGSAAEVDCLFDALYGQSYFFSEAEDVLGGEGTYGEILPGGVEKIFHTIAAMGAPLGSGDAFYDLGSGVGKVVLQAYLTTQAESSIGIELESKRHAAAVNALASLQKMVGPSTLDDFSTYAGFIRDDIRDSSVWANASVVHASVIAFPKDLLFEITWSLSRALQPGAMVFVHKKLPGCHSGLRMFGSFRASMSFHYSVEVFVYIVPPVILAPLQGIKLNEKSWQAETRTEFEAGSNGSASLDTHVLLLQNQWRCESAICKKLALRTIASVQAKISKDALMVPYDSLDAVSIDRLMSAFTHAARGEYASVIECLYVDLVAAAHAEDEKPGRIIPLLFSPKREGVADSRAGNTLQDSTTLAVELLIEHRVDLDLRDHKGRTFLSYSSERGDSKFIALLLSHGAHVNSTDSRPLKTPLHYASMTASTAAVTALLDSGAYINAQDADGNTPLHGCIPRGKTIEMASKLLEAGAAPEATTQLGVTPLAQACMYGHIEMVKLLLRHRASPSRADVSGVMPIEYAKLSGHAELLALVSPRMDHAQEL